MWGPGYSQYALGNTDGCPLNKVYKLKTRKTWSHCRETWVIWYDHWGFLCLLSHVSGQISTNPTLRSDLHPNLAQQVRLVNWLLTNAHLCWQSIQLNSMLISVEHATCQQQCIRRANIVKSKRSAVWRYFTLATQTTSLLYICDNVYMAEEAEMTMLSFSSTHSCLLSLSLV